MGGTLQYSSATTTTIPATSAPPADSSHVDTNGQNVTWATALTGGTGYLSKYGTGTLTLSSSASNYTWGTAIYAGTVNVGVRARGHRSAGLDDGWGWNPA